MRALLRFYDRMLQRLRARHAPPPPPPPTEDELFEPWRWVRSGGEA